MPCTHNTARRPKPRRLRCRAVYRFSSENRQFVRMRYVRMCSATLRTIAYHSVEMVALVQRSGSIFFAATGFPFCFSSDCASARVRRDAEQLNMQREIIAPIKMVLGLSHLNGTRFHDMGAFSEEKQTSVRHAAIAERCSISAQRANKFQCRNIFRVQ